MVFSAQVSIKGSRQAVWAAMTDIEHAANTIRGIDQIELLDKPAQGLVGLRWRETRMLFGKPAAVEKWITEAVENTSYQTRAESDGFIFICTKTLSDHNGEVILTERHESLPQSFMKRCLAVPMMFLFKGVAEKAIQQDVDDIKTAVERT